MLLALLPCTAAAQGVRWGVAAGASLQRLALEEPLPEWDDTGLVFPTLMAYMERSLTGIDGPLGRRLHLLAGIRYNRQAGRIDWTFTVGQPPQQFEGQFTLRQHYVSVPVWLRLDLGGSPLFLVAGPEVGVLVAANKESQTLAPVASRSDRTESVADQLRRMHVALRGGVGAALTPRVRLLAVLGVGLSDIKDGVEQTVLVTDWRTREWEVMLMYRLD